MVAKVGAFRKVSVSLFRKSHYSCFTTIAGPFVTGSGYDRPLYFAKHGTGKVTI